MFEVRVRMEQPGVFAPLVDLLTVMRQAREVARHFRINPTCTRTNLVGDALRDIEIAHALLTVGRFEEPAGDMRTDITFDKQTAAGFVAGERTLRDVVLYIDEGERVPFMDTFLDFGRLAWELAEATVYTPPDELTQFLAEPGDSVTVSFRTPPGGRRVLRPLDAEELRMVQGGAAPTAAVRVRKSGPDAA